MKKILIFLILTVLLLNGCAAQNPAPTVPTGSAAPVVTEPSTVSEPEAPFLRLAEESPAAAVFQVPRSVTGFLPLGENLLFFSGKDNTTLTLVDAGNHRIIAEHHTGLALLRENSTVQLLRNGFSFFNSSEGETVMLDTALREIRRIDAPDDLTGMPLLSPDGSTLYYCTASAVRALDVSSGISRILKESAYPMQSLSGILLDGAVLQISITDTDGSRRTLFLSSENGQLLQESEGNLLPETSADSYLLQQNGSVFFGQTGSSTMLLHPLLDDADCFFLENSYSAVTASIADGTTILDYYDLSSGLRTAQLTIDGIVSPAGLTRTADGSIWFLNIQEEPVLYRWAPAASALNDGTCYSSPYYTRAEPDYEGLAACSLLSQELSEKHGVEILIYKDAVALEPWDYHLDYEYQTAILRQELEALDRRLSAFPAGFLQTLRDRFTALKFCIVRSAAGSPESGSLESVSGIQFMDEFDAYIVLTTDHDTEYALYHELSHLMETVVLTESVAYDRWENLNPTDFKYDNSYAVNQARDGSPWMKPGKEYFIDTYSMSYAKEDRARLFEYAMTAGHEELFSSPNLQAKLRQLCTGIREAFGLKKYQQILPWEQYLSE